jgi:regulator of protease activity HflC (stomatin/prohibitin superfamily)
MWVEQLIAVIVKFSFILSPLTWVDVGAGGVMLRWGKFQRKVGPGAHWKWPVMDILHDANIVTTTINLPSQSLTTKDDIPIVISMVVKYSIDNTEYYFTRVYDAKDAISDIVLGEISNTVQSNDYHNLAQKLTNVKDNVYDEINYWGVCIEKITLSDLQRCRSFRVLQDYVYKDIV